VSPFFGATDTHSRRQAPSACAVTFFRFPPAPSRATTLAILQNYHPRRPGPPRPKRPGLSPSYFFFHNLGRQNSRGGPLLRYHSEVMFPDSARFPFSAPPQVARWDFLENSSRGFRVAKRLPFNISPWKGRRCLRAPSITPVPLDWSPYLLGSEVAPPAVNLSQKNQNDRRLERN